MPTAPRPATPPPPFETVRTQLDALGGRHPDIARLEVFGSVAADRAQVGSDVDVLITFVPECRPAGWDYFGRLDDLAQEISEVLGGSTIDLHERRSAELCENPRRRAAVLDGARLVYGT